MMFSNATNFDSKTGIPTCNKYHEDQFSIGKCIILLLTSTALEENCDTRHFFQNPPVWHDSIHVSIQLWYHLLNVHASSSGIYVHAYELLTKGYNPIGFKFDNDLPLKISTLLHLEEQYCLISSCAFNFPY
jgi:hypothetical protein